MGSGSDAHTRFHNTVSVRILDISQQMPVSQLPSRWGVVGRCVQDLLARYQARDGGMSCGGGVRSGAHLDNVSRTTMHHSNGLGN